MSNAHLRMTYDGPALQTHRMDVRLLAPALLAFGDLCESAAKAVYGESVTARVEVRASFRTGSFGIDLDVAANLMQQLMGWLRGDAAASIVNGAALLSLIGVTGKGLIGALRWIGERKIKRIEATPNGRRILTEDGDALEVEEAIVVLLQDRTVRTHLQEVIAPIEMEGIETLAFGTDDRIDVVIERREAVFFHVPPPEDHLIFEEVRTIPFSIVSLSFREDNKWRLFDGQATIYATIADQDFLNRVNKNVERFAKGDILICETRVSHWQTADGLRTEYVILRVIEHRHGAAQIQLPLDG